MANWNQNPDWSLIATINEGAQTEPGDGFLASDMVKVVENLQYLFNHINNIEGNYVVKSDNQGSYLVYARKAGVEGTYEVTVEAGSAHGSSIPLRNAAGNVQTGTPVQNSEAANKEYVDAHSGVASVNGKTGTVVLNSDDISDEGRTHKFATTRQLLQIETNVSNIMSLSYSKQDKSDNDLDTTSKTVVGAINEVNTAIQNVREVAEGKNKAVVLNYQTTFDSSDYADYLKPDGTGFSSKNELVYNYLGGYTYSCINNSFNSQDNYFSLYDGLSRVLVMLYTPVGGNSKYTLIKGEDIATYFKTGDIIYVSNTDVPDRWISISTLQPYGSIANVLETTKVALTAYQTKTDNNLETSDKTVVGAINELNDEVNEIPNGYFPNMVAGYSENFVGKRTPTERNILYTPTGATRTNSSWNAIDIVSKTATIKELKGKSLFVANIADYAVFLPVSWGGVQYDNNHDGTVTYYRRGESETVPETSYYRIVQDTLLNNEHSYLFGALGTLGASDFHLEMQFNGANPLKATNSQYVICQAPSNNITYKGLFISAEVGTSIPAQADAKVLSNIMCIDLTETFGAGNEPTTVEEVFSEIVYRYYIPNGELIHFNASILKTTGFNQCRLVDSVYRVKAISNMQYQITGTYTAIMDGTTEITPDINGKFTLSDNTELTITGANATTCVHFVWTGSKDGVFEEYVEWQKSLPIAQYFPTGIKSAGAIYDSITSEKAVQRIGVQSVEGLKDAVIELEDCASSATEYKCSLGNIGTLSGKNLTLSKDVSAPVDVYFPLDTPNVTVFTEPLNLTYTVNDFGTEEVNSEIAMDASIVYELDYEGIVRRGTTEYATHADLEAYPTKTEVATDLSGKVDKITSGLSNNENKVYSVYNNNGTYVQQTTRAKVGEPVVFGIPMWDSVNLNIQTNTPVANKDCANKAYVDGKVKATWTNTQPTLADYNAGKILAVYLYCHINNEEIQLCYPVKRNYATEQFDGFLYPITVFKGGFLIKANAWIALSGFTSKVDAVLVMQLTSGQVPTAVANPPVVLDGVSYLVLS